MPDDGFDPSSSFLPLPSSRGCGDAFVWVLLRRLEQPLHEVFEPSQGHQCLSWDQKEYQIGIPLEVKSQVESIDCESIVVVGAEVVAGDEHDVSGPSYDSHDDKDVGEIRVYVFLTS